MAQFNLGVVYAKGESVSTDYVRAYAWLSTVAARGNANGKKAKEIVTNLMASALYLHWINAGQYVPHLPVIETKFG